MDNFQDSSNKGIFPTVVRVDFLFGLYSSLVEKVHVVGLKRKIRITVERLKVVNIEKHSNIMRKVY